MGKGAILSGGDDGLYSVKMDRGKDLKDRAIAECDKLIVALTANLAEYPPFITARENAIAQLQAALANAIAIYEFWVQIDPAGSNAKDAAKGVNNILADKLKSEGDLQELIARQNIVKGQLKAAQQRKAALQNVAAEVTQNIWCADYTLDKTGNINTIELPGEPSTVIVEPQSRPDDAPALLPPGDVVARELMRSDHVYLNAAILPGWQAYKPTYRKGVIITTDTAADTATVGLLPAVSSAKDKYFKTLDINHRSPVTLTDVPVTYMTCNAAAFEPGDSVVVQFEGQDWTKPRVIGFVERPKPCTVFVLAQHGHFYNPGTATNEHRSMYVLMSSAGNKISEGMLRDDVRGWRYEGAFSISGKPYFAGGNDGGIIDGDDHKIIVNAQTGIESPLPEIMFELSTDKGEMFAIDLARGAQLYTLALDEKTRDLRRVMGTWPAGGYAYVQDTNFGNLVIGGWTGSTYSIRFCDTAGNYIRAHDFGDILMDVATAKDYYSRIVLDGPACRLYVYSTNTGAEVDNMELPDGFEQVTMHGNTIMVLCHYRSTYSPYMGVLWQIEIIDGLLTLVSETTPFSDLISAHGLTLGWAGVGR